MQPAKILPWVQFPAGKHIFKTSNKKMVFKSDN